MGSKGAPRWDCIMLQYGSSFVVENKNQFWLKCNNGYAEPNNLYLFNNTIRFLPLSLSLFLSSPLSLSLSLSPSSILILQPLVGSSDIIIRLLLLWL